MTLTIEQAEKIIEQICEGKSFSDQMQEYYEGESQTYSFYRAEEKFYLRRMDIIVGSYNTLEEISKATLIDYLRSLDSSVAKEQGFKI